jgi:hypothetical protein
MNIVHLNGDIVVCPDTAEEYIKRQRRYDSEYSCKYGVKEELCCSYSDYFRSLEQPGGMNNNYSRCPGGDFCPFVKKLQKASKRKKTYKIDNSTYRKIASAGQYLMRTNKNKCIFFTLTFPPFRQRVTNKMINEAFSKFVENLRRNYHCAGYVAVREFGLQRGRVHFHIICAMPFVPFTKLNAAWCHAIRDISWPSPNALQTEKGRAVIYDAAGALRYICKYFSKAYGQESATKIVFISNNILSTPVEVVTQDGEIIRRRQSNLTREMTGNIEKHLQGYKMIYIRSYDWSTVYSIRDKDSFSRFMTDKINVLFGLTPGHSGLNFYSSG